MSSESVALLEAEAAGPRLSWSFPSLGEASGAVPVLAARAQLLGEPRWSSRRLSGSAGSHLGIILN